MLVSIILASSSFIWAQDADSLVTTPDDPLSFTDSLSIFSLLDSLMTLDTDPGSQLAVRLAYNSNVLSAGRTLGIDQFGLAPGISYYHKSGAFVDVSSFWSNDFDPSYYLSIVSAGYIHLFSKRFSVIGSYDHYFYNLGKDAYISYSNTLSVSPYLDLKYVALRADYSYYFGEQTAHRITPSLNFRLTKKKLFGLEKVSFSPGAALLAGNETFTDIEVVFPNTRIEALRNYRQYGTFYKVVETTRKVFGVMNYAISFPLLVSHKNWSFTCTYVYNIPKALPGETLTLKEGGYLSASITRYINLKKPGH